MNPVTFESYVQQRLDDTLKILGLQWINLYEIKKGSNEATLTLVSGPAPSIKSFEASQVKSVLDSEILEPLHYQGDLLGWVAGYRKPNSQSHFGAKEDLQSFASQMACFFHSKNRNRTATLDSYVSKIHGAHPEKYHWTGIYLIEETGLLALETFRGEPTPHMIIPTDSGICGAAVREEKLLNIPDVKADPRYLSCSILTKSEIVVPISARGKVIGEIDIDSHVKNAFSEQDEMELRDFSEQMGLFLSHL